MSDMELLVGAFARLPHPTGDLATFAPEVAIGETAPDGAIALSGLAETLEDWGAAATATEVGVDDKLRAAYLMGDLARSVMAAFLGLGLAGAWITRISPQSVFLSIRYVDWKKDDASGTEAVFDVFLVVSDIEATANRNDEVQISAIVSLFDAPVALMSELWGLGRSALWRLVGDGVSVTLLMGGRLSKRQDETTAIGRGLLHRRGTRLYSKQANFINVSLPEQPEISMTCRVRGGCCRYYTLARSEGEYCTSCVLRDDQSRRERIIDYLRRTHAA